MALPADGFIQQVEIVVGGILPRAGFVQPVELVGGGSPGSDTTAWHNTGDAYGPGKFIGTTDAQPFVIYTNNTERARFTSAGLLGIGTTNPQVDVDLEKSSIAGIVRYRASNTDNTNVNSHASFLAKVGGASGGDPYVQFTVSGLTDWAIGLDNSDSDTLKVCASAQIGTIPILTVSTAGVFSIVNSADAAKTVSFVTNSNGDMSISASTGDQFAFQQSLVGSSLSLEVNNLDTTNLVSGAKVRMSVGGTGAGDPYATWVVVTGTTYTLGIDNSDNDTLKLTNNSTPSDGTTLFSVDQSGNMFVLGKLTVTGAIDPPSILLSGGTALFFESNDGSTAPVSGAATGRIRYNNSTATWQVSVQGGAYASIATGTTGVTLDGAYDFGGAGAGRTITVDSGAVTLTGSGTTVGGLTVNGSRTIASAAGAVWNETLIDADVSLSGSTNVTTATGFNMVALNAPTITDAGTITSVDFASTLYVGGPPVGSGLTVTNPYSMWVDSGNARFDGIVYLKDGTDISPAFGPLSSTNVGVYFDITGDIRFSIGGLVYRFTRNTFAMTPEAAASGVPTSLSLVAAASTNQTASTEVVDVDFNLSRILQHATGALTNQRAFVVRAPTYSFVGASTITNAATLYIDQAPQVGTNATITNAYALWVDAGTSRFDGTVNITAPAGSANALNLTNGSVASLSGSMLTLTAVANSGGAWKNITVTGANDTAITTVTELPLIDINYSSNTYTWATGSFANQRFVRIQAPTIAAAGSSTITDAATVGIVGAPIAGTNATLTSSYALLIQGGNHIKCSLSSTVASAAGAVWNSVLFTQACSLTGSTNVTTATGFNMVTLNAPTITDAGTITSISLAATLYVGGAPTGSGLTITSAYALWVDDGLTRLDGAMLLSGATSQYIESTDGSAAGVSGAATGRIRYNNSTATWQVSVQGGAYASIGTGSGTVTASGPPVANQVPYWTTATNITGKSTFTFDPSDDTFTLNFQRFIGGNSIYIGAGAGNVTTSTSNAVGIGTAALASITTALITTAVGNNALTLLQDGIANTAFGNGTLSSQVSGGSCSAFGNSALNLNTVDNNSAFGARSLVNNTSGTRQCAFGRDALEDMQTGDDSSAFGYTALANATGASNSAFGSKAGDAIVGGTGNCAFGLDALGGASSGNDSVAIGRASGASLTTGGTCTFVGATADTSGGTITNSTAIGFGAIVAASNTIVLGNASVVSVTLPSGMLIVGGETTGVAGKVGYTNTVNNAANSSGVGAILMKGTTSRNSTGYLKILDGTTARFIPYFDAITG